MHDLILATLAAFDIQATIASVTTGPRVLRFELSLAQGIRLGKIRSLADNLALALAVEAVRIEAPIPGTSLVGLEVPNPAPAPVLFDKVLAGAVLGRPLEIALGLDVSGQPVVIDLASAPHLLVAGSTGTGKSVCVNTIIATLLRRSVDEVRLVLLDPKRVEFQPYAGLPHLALPIARGADEALKAIAWLVGEMDFRYTQLEALGVRDLDGYNASGANPYPRLVMVIDELADLLVISNHTVEYGLCRLAQLGRAAGVHLVIATQRPDRFVLTGVIKANIPSRIALATSSAVNSRIILDQAGAEKLLGRGDMLLSMVGEGRLKRLQGSMIDSAMLAPVVDRAMAMAGNTVYPGPGPAFYVDPVPEVVEYQPMEYDHPLRRWLRNEISRDAIPIEYRLGA
jgi:S-DNA-T family DNA segregation ATPase FtsK/SpoIIIE